MRQEAERLAKELNQVTGRLVAAVATAAPDLDAEAAAHHLVDRLAALACETARTATPAPPTGNESGNETEGDLVSGAAVRNATPQQLQAVDDGRAVPTALAVPNGSTAMRPAASGPERETPAGHDDRRPEPPSPVHPATASTSSTPVSPSSLRHKKVPGLGGEWTMTQADPDVEAYVLWWKKTTQVGRVAREWSRRHDRAVWQAQHTPAEGKQRSRQRLVFAGYKNDGFASRAAALRALAAEAVHRRRQATIHRDEPIEGLPAGWRLVQSQAEADEGRWRVVAPGGQVAGTLRRTTYGGRREWQARSGDPDSDRIGVELPPMPTSSYRGVDEQAWRTRMPAARAIAAYHDLDLDTPDLDV